MIKKCSTAKVKSS